MYHPLSSGVRDENVDAERFYVRAGLFVLFARDSRWQGAENSRLHRFFSAALFSSEIFSLEYFIHCWSLGLIRSRIIEFFLVTPSLPIPPALVEVILGTKVASLRPK